MSESPFHSAIDDLGGPTKAAAILGRKQPTISGYLKDGKPPADVCMRVEVATKGKHRAEQLRPDLADDFKAFRAMQKPAPKKTRRAA
jgi:DNA-binding transcriptional regulator YdaS (Cro superfamily)